MTRHLCPVTCDRFRRGSGLTVPICAVPRAVQFSKPTLPFWDSSRTLPVGAGLPLPGRDLGPELRCMGQESTAVGRIHGRGFEKYIRSINFSASAGKLVNWMTNLCVSWRLVTIVCVLLLCVLGLIVISTLSVRVKSGWLV